MRISFSSNSSKFLFFHHGGQCATEQVPQFSFNTLRMRKKKITNARGWAQYTNATQCQ